MSPPPDPSPTPLDEATPTAIDAVFDALVADIVRGTYPPGTRLPAERELARRLGASRPTLREALRRLDEWNMVAARRGSGILVRDRREWMIEALGAYLRHARPGPDRPSIGLLASDILLLRRLIMVDLIRLMGARVTGEGVAAARDRVARAWRERGDPVAYAEHDFEVLRGLAESARSLPTMWMINRISGVYLDIVRSLSGAISAAPDYVEVYGRVLDAIAGGEVEAAARTLDAYLERHDSALLAALGVKVA